MSDVDAPPDTRAQIAGLTFAMLSISPDLTIASVNPAGEDLLGKSANRLIGVNLLDVIDFGEERVIARLRTSDTQMTARNLAIHIGTRETKANLTVSPIPSAPGWRVVTLSDAGQGERFGDDELGGPLRGPAVLAHEIKNPLAAIRGAAQLLGRKLSGADRKLTTMVVEEVDRIAALIDRMQRIGREQTEPVTPVNLHTAIRRACEIIRAGQPEDDAFPNLIEEFDPSLPSVLANEGALVQVLINLVANARDACRTHIDPIITIQTRFVSGLVLNVIRLGRPVKLPIEVRVSDNGPGIDQALKEHIFEPFVSGKPNGHGLGLALVRRLVRDMNGRITHDRDDLAGLTHFRVHLPMIKSVEEKVA